MDRQPSAGAAGAGARAGVAWVTWIWLHWYVALRAEAAVLAGASGRRRPRGTRPGRSSPATRSPAPSWTEPRRCSMRTRKRLLATAVAFDAAGCRYQSARTLVLAGGDHADRGAAALADLGFAPVTPPPPHTTAPSVTPPRTGALNRARARAFALSGLSVLAPRSATRYGPTLVPTTAIVYGEAGLGLGPVAAEHLAPCPAPVRRQRLDRPS